MIVYLTWYIHTIVQVLFGFRVWNRPTLIYSYNSLHRRCLILFNSVPFHMESAMTSAPRFTKSTRLESVLWAIDYSPFTYILVRTAAALHPLSSRTDGNRVNVIQELAVMQRMGNTPSQHIFQQPLQLLGYARSRPGPRVSWGDR